MSEAHTRVYIIFLCINIVLMLGGFSVAGSSNIAQKGYSISSTSDSTGQQGLLTFLITLVDFFVGGGIIGMLTSAGIPTEIQWIIGVPFAVLSLIILASLITSGLTLLRSA